MLTDRQDTIDMLRADVQAAEEILSSVRRALGPFFKPGQQLAYSVTRLAEAHSAATRTAEMYGRAWEREIGPPYRAKAHHIDCLVLTTRDRIAELNRYRQLECDGVNLRCFNCGKPHRTESCDQPEVNP
jgi:hypothetical protein